MFGKRTFVQLEFSPWRHSFAVGNLGLGDFFSVCKSLLEVQRFSFIIMTSKMRNNFSLNESLVAEEIKFIGTFKMSL